MGITPLTPAARAVMVAAAVGASAVLGTACQSTGRSMAPLCTAARFEPLMLVAQSVPTAERIPCIVSYPAGWSLGRVEVRSGRSVFTLRSDRVDGTALKVTLDDTCDPADVAGAMQVPTDELGTIRRDRRIPDHGSIREVRTYGIPGGCVTHEFGFRHDQTLMDEASLAVGFVTRVQIDATARQATGGQVHL